MMDMWTLCEKYPAYYNLQHSVTYNSDVQWNILINHYTHAFPGEKGTFLLPDISTILNLISVLKNSHEVPAS